MISNRSGRAVFQGMPLASTVTPRCETGSLEPKDAAERATDAATELVDGVALTVLFRGLIIVLDIGPVHGTVDRGHRELGLVVLVAGDRTPLSREIAGRRIDDRLSHTRRRIPCRRRCGLLPALQIKLRPRRRGESTTGCVARYRRRHVVTKPDGGDDRWREADEPDVRTAVGRAGLAGDQPFHAVVANDFARTIIDHRLQHRSHLIRITRIHYLRSIVQVWIRLRPAR